MKRRITKKSIRYICGDAAAECIITKHFCPNIDTEEITKCILDIATLQTASLSKVNVKFDKVKSDYNNPTEYRKEKCNFYRKAFASIKKEFKTKLSEIAAEMNKAAKA